MVDKTSRSDTVVPTHFEGPSFNINVAQRLNRRLTYRTINEWEVRGLISPARKTKGVGWRRFSGMDIMKLFIIADLKRLGFSNGEIKTVLNRISSSNIQKGTRIESLRQCIRESLSTKARFLLFILERTTPRFVRENDNWKELLSHRIKYGHPAVILPMADYVIRLSDRNILCGEAKQKV